MAVLVTHGRSRGEAGHVVKLTGIKSKRASPSYTVENEPERGGNASELAVNKGLYVSRPTQLRHQVVCVTAGLSA